MRQPTPLSEQLAWWQNAIATGNNAITDDYPRCGWFKARQRAWSKTWLPARIWLHQPIEWTTGELAAPETFVLQVADRKWTDQAEIEDRWMRLRAVTVSEWEWLSVRLELHLGTTPPAYDAAY